MVWSGLLQEHPASSLWAGLFMAVVLLAAMWTDRRWGEPPTPFHPVVWMGHGLQFCGRFIQRLPAAPAFVLGALAWCVGATAVGAVAFGIQFIALELVLLAIGALSLGGLPLIEDLSAALLMGALLAWSLKCMLSWRMLRGEAEAVEAALAQSLEQGRERLSWLVSRDTTVLTAGEVRESAIESLAENLNDSVVAPVFWFVVFGLPGAAVYRFANTADAMWGYRGTYRGQHWEWAGKWAARADDVLSWLPARLTAVLLALSAGGLHWAALRREARKTPSPNSGWPMAAMALALGIGLRKPGVYVLNPEGREPTASDMAAAQRLAARALGALLPLAVAVIAAIGSWAWLVWA